MDGVREQGRGLTDYFEAEAALRQGSYRREEDVERALLEMNDALAAQVPTGTGSQPHATVLICGLPRSGTTLLYQALCWSLDVGYPNNLIARFWKAPAYGVALTRAVLGEERDDSFLSDYGRTPSIAGPHEFRFFWQQWLDVHALGDHLDFGDHRGHPGWPGLRSAVADMQAAFDRPLVFKSLYLGQFLPGLCEAFDKPLVVYVDRDPRDVALSILAARRSYYGRSDVWWSTMPPDYLELADLPFDVQIARQVTELRRIYEAKLAKLEPGTWVRVSYEDLCHSPAEAVAAVTHALRDEYGVAPDVINSLPASFPFRRSEAQDAEATAVIAALELENRVG